MTRNKIITSIVITSLVALSFGQSLALNKIYELTNAQYPIVVNGTTYTDQENPVLNYNGVTYVPLKKIGVLLNAEVKWNESSKSVTIGKTPEQSQEGDYEMSNELEIYTVDGVKYVVATLLSTRLPKENQLKWTEGDSTLLIDNTDINIPYKVVNRRTCILYSDYLTFIKPRLIN